MIKLTPSCLRQDVDFSSSFLCGYLCIRGLTDDWPELTTYFDAEIIGSRYGFLTRGWGADEEGDMVHWARFPAFRHVKNKLKAPHLTMDGYPGAVFMRWKERFLVPDHRVQDINGASFAGTSSINLIPSLSQSATILTQVFIMFVSISTRTRRHRRRPHRPANHRHHRRWKLSQNPCLTKGALPMRRMEVPTSPHRSAHARGPEWLP